MLIVPSPGLFEVTPRGEVSGPGPEVLGRLAVITRLKLTFIPMPAARAMQTLRQLPPTCMAGVPRLPEREGEFRWAGMMATAAISVYARSDDMRQVSHPEDLRGTTLAVLRESMPLAWARERGLSVYEVNDTVTGLRMLRAGRVDLWLSNDLIAQRAIQSQGGDPPRMLYSSARIDNYIACHHDVDPAVLERLQAGMEQLRRDGALAQFGVK